MAAQKDLWDAIVIGAGIQGCFTTYHLAKHGKRVLLLEQFLLPHSRGSSHGQSRIIRKVYSEDFYTQMMDECYWMWAQLERESGTPLYRKTELLLLGKENPELKTMQATLSRQGIEYQYLSSEELKQRFPNLRLTNEEVGLLDKTGGVLYADKALRALQDAIHQFGGTVKDGEKTLRINVCYWPEKVPGSYSVSQAFPCFMWLGLAPHSIYGLPSGEYPGLMKVCYHHGNSADPEERDYPMAPSDTQDVQILCRIVKDRFPDLKPEPAIMERCIYTNTPDKHFVLDRHPKYDNIVIGAGFSGHGFKLAPVVGKILYELSMKLMLSYDLAPFRISRFSGLGKAHL
ncbi:peroxisomal sarcosine oxidase isoform X3 [Heterocephalus glaber]|uniref:Peroxisomal sarcosine oxidase isoform X3 n=1 Tax=Heterocephalus glaber TaxID=10181 RepID=A0AAX6PQE8_HETGA|nr:peroxisomal sarcosine oxidase isoform X3 [Heterocephalus glaber]